VAGNSVGCYLIIECHQRALIHIEEFIRMIIATELEVPRRAIRVFSLV